MVDNYNIKFEGFVIMKKWSFRPWFRLMLCEMHSKLLPMDTENVKWIKFS